MSVDTIINFLTRIRNAIMASKPSVTVPYSKMNTAIAKILQEEGFVRLVELLEQDTIASKKMRLVLKYVDGESVIHEITRVSVPGRRAYTGGKKIKPVIGGLGISIVSTSRGVLTNKKAKELNVGGELLCTVW